ncbi:MAG TPA: LuxR C-terminal-related transcriptional regulator [Fimbriimonadaceae bacterium]|nr:LuxR C-terminal-related transcriptional regulator [Fimbriimonadaceae bacterium]
MHSVRRFVGPSYARQPYYQHQPPQYQPYYPPPPSPYMGMVQEPMSVYGTPRMLTKRELEVAQLVAQGMPNRRIAAVLQLQEQSIKNLVSSVMRKLDCENRVQVALRLSGRQGTAT